jgi:hypothetical protein
MNDNTPIPPEDFAAVEAAFRDVLPIRAPVGFAERVVKAEVRRRAVNRAVRVGFASGLAACLVVALGWPRPAPQQRPDLAVNTPAAPRLGEKAAEARAAVVAMTVKTTEQTLAPAKSLFTAAAAPTPTSKPTPLSDFPAAARSGLDPFAATAKRAFEAIRRDTVPSAKF